MKMNMNTPSNIEGTKHVCIGIATYKRPEMLEQALRSIEKIEIPESTIITLLVCDNTPAADSQKQIEDLIEGMPMQCYYLQEPRKGFSFVRNKILDGAIQKDADFLTFIDDDEVVTKNWLAHMLNCINLNHAHVVRGSIEFLLPEHANEFAKIYFRKISAPSGTLSTTAFTGNSMIDLSFVRKNNLKFDQRFNLSGGEDVFFFETMYRLGAKIVWCQEALVQEAVPDNRLQEAWIFNRIFKVTLVRYLINKIESTRTFYSMHIFFDALLDIIISLLKRPFRLLFSAEKKFNNKKSFTKAHARLNAVFRKKWLRKKLDLQLDKS